MAKPRVRSSGSSSSSFTVTLQIEGVRETLDAFKRLPKDASDELRLASTELSQDLAGSVTSAARGEGRQAALMASTVKARKDRLPIIVAGGAKRVGRNRKPAYKLLFGSEFGSSRLGQYRPHLGRGSYWFFKTVEDQQPKIAARWREAADEIIRKFGGA